MKNATSSFLTFSLILIMMGCSSLIGPKETEVEIRVKNESPYKEFNIVLGNIGWKKYRFLRVDYVRSYVNGVVDDALMFGLSF